LQFGFNVYRVTPGLAATHQWILDPPEHGALASAVAAGDEGIARVNSLPILVGSPLTQDQAGDTADRKTVFVIDNNQRFRTGGTPFQNGDQFYYYVVGRDILGRDGNYSLGTLVTICDRIPPASPKVVRVENDFSFAGEAEKHVLKVRWHAPIPKEGESITRYFVYRWDSVEQMQLSQGNPAINRIGVLEADASETVEFIDDGTRVFVSDGAGGNLIHVAAEPGVPSAPEDYSKTFWYTVRAVDNSACGGNLSGNSAPAFGVLRDRSFNGRATATIGVVQERLGIAAVGTEMIPIDAGDTATVYYYRFENTLSSTDVVWSEFYLGTAADGPQQLLCRMRASSSGLQQIFDGRFQKNDLTGDEV
ncbi:MAG: hypothetical protein KAI66_28040, partial [Lentisphaeria bacterium]|nr:hypothetical protein [Lentisphaeria bacterium]